ncbi:MAG TPA: hypothetical protein VMX17_00760 [Candidatus Glassbacteria bacterium]|nr:hypothetical protein [Candidatus Glassbacteria bacterium]
MSSSYTTALGIGNKLGSTIRQASDTSAIDEIFKTLSENASEEEIKKAKYTIVSKVSPERQKAALGLVEESEKRASDNKKQSSFESLANELVESNPDSSLYKSYSNIMKSKLPHGDKLTLLKNFSDSIPYRNKQQERLDLDQKFKFINTEIREIDTDLKKYWDQSDPEAQKLLQRKRKLQSDRESLGELYGIVSPPDEQETIEEKVTFDPSNPEHMKIFKETEKKFKGKKDKINQFLSEQFTL